MTLVSQEAAGVIIQLRIMISSSRPHMPGWLDTQAALNAVLFVPCAVTAQAGADLAPACRSLNFHHVTIHAGVSLWASMEGQCPPGGATHNTPAEHNFLHHPA